MDVPSLYLPGKISFFSPGDNVCLWDPGSVAKTADRGMGIAGRKCEVLILGLQSDWLFGQSNVFQQGTGRQSLRKSKLQL